MAVEVQHLEVHGEGKKWVVVANAGTGAEAVVSDHDLKQDAVNKALSIADDGERVSAESKRTGTMKVLEPGRRTGSIGGAAGFGLERDLF